MMVLRRIPAAPHRVGLQIEPPTTQFTVKPRSSGSPSSTKPPAGLLKDDLPVLKNSESQQYIARLPQFVKSLAEDRAGNIWIGCEDVGLFRYSPSTRRWAHFTVQDGLGDDNAYAITCDHHGRIWVGHLNHGVSVFNGKHWRNYDVFDGPAGERVFAIAVSPRDGDIWIATSAGLTRYSDALDHWFYYTRASGLPTALASSIAFDPHGRIYVGTQCDGVLMSDPTDSYSRWKQIDGPVSLATEPEGEGLPNASINDVLVSRQGTVYAATPTGIAWSTDRGTQWHYRRGADWADKVRQRYGGAPLNWSERPRATLTEDYVTRLAEDSDAVIWIGHRQKGLERFDKDALSPQSPPPDRCGTAQTFVSAILPLRGLKPLYGTYGAGLFRLPSSTDAAHRSSSTESAGTMSYPSPAEAPTLVDLLALRAQLDGISSVNEADCVELADDWCSQGNWLGRYGRYWACLASMVSPEYLWGGGSSVNYVASIGPNHEQGDVVRHWVQWLYTSNPRSLEMPPVYFDSRLAKNLTTPEKFRRQSEWDDHGESYPLAHEGPDIYCQISVPHGDFILSLYDYNKLGHSGWNSLRDYRVDITKDTEGTEASTASNREIAHARIFDFWGGVYKRFLVRGPGHFTVKVRRAGSHNAILAAVMLDLLDERPAAYLRVGESPLPAPQLMRSVDARVYYLELARYLQSPLARLNPLNAIVKLERLEVCYYALAQFDRWERVQTLNGQQTIRQIEKSLRWDRTTSENSGKELRYLDLYLRPGRSSG
jgi:hypothetical protein